MTRSIKLSTPRPTFESLIKRLRISKARQRELQAIVRGPESHKLTTLEIARTTSGIAIKQEEDLQRAASAR